LSNGQFVDQAYRDLLHRAADPLGLAAWNNFLDGGGSRLEVIQGIERSPEFFSNAVDDVYGRLLHRSADAAGRDAFIEFMDSGGTLERSTG
jgi:hypothetical protein